MKERVFISLASLAALFCVAVLLYLTGQIERARRTLQQDGIVQFNYIQQNDHNFDEFAHALRAWQQARREDPDAPRDFLTRFDIIWSALGIGSKRWAGTMSDVPANRALHADARAFVERAEPSMRPDAELDDPVIDSLVDEARALGRRTYEIGLDLYVRKSRQRDEVAARMDRLLDALRFFAAALLAAGLALSALLTRAWRRSAALFEQSSAAQVQLSAALEELTSGDIRRRRQNRFIATASHDLRQPLHALGLYLTTLRGHVATPLGTRILDNASRSTKALNELLSSVLDVSRLDAEVIEVRKAELALDDVFEHLQRMFGPAAEERGLDYDVRFAGLAVRTDRVLLERILANLVSNAIRYTERGRVTLAAEASGEEVLVTVSDTGPGIPERERESVFDEFYQVDLPEGMASSGLGLGLSIVHRLARLLDLPLSIDSTLGAGTRFALRVPLGDAAALAGEPPAPLPARFDGVHFDGLVVLVVDDDRDVRDGMHRLLEQRSCHVMAVESATEARAAVVAEEVIPDVIVADYRLRDGMTGDHAIAEIREEVNEDVPALIVTADTSPARLREASASGFRLLHKPVVPEELFDAIGELAGRIDR